MTSNCKPQTRTTFLELGIRQNVHASGGLKCRRLWYNIDNGALYKQITAEYLKRNLKTAEYFEDPIYRHYDFAQVGTMALLQSVEFSGDDGGAWGETATCTVVGVQVQGCPRS